MVNSCRKVLFFDREPVRSTFAGRYCDAKQVWRTVALRCSFVMRSQFGDLLQECIFFGAVLV